MNMLEIILIIYLTICAVCGFGFAFFMAFFALDDPSIPEWMSLFVYIAAFVILGTVFFLCALVLLPVLLWEWLWKRIIR